MPERRREYRSAPTSANTNSVSTLGITANASYDPAEMQAVINKLNELINAGRR